MIPPTVTNSVISELLPKAIKVLGNAFDYVFSPSNEIEHISTRKLSDCTRLTQIDYDIVIEEYSFFMERNKNRAKGTKRETQKELTIIINKRLNLDKSRSAYARIWTGKVDRKSLATGY